jgi:hypothetical protein
MNICLRCQKPTKNPKYCSMSCSAICANLKKVKKKYYCKDCNILVGEGFINKKKYCDKCSAPGKHYNNLTLEDIFSKYLRHQAHAKLRGWARIKYNRSGKPKFCLVCKYDTEYCI